MIAELIHVVKSYDQVGNAAQNPVLDDISLSIAVDEAIAVTGPSGSGKSTLLNILGTLDRPGSGVLKLDGVLPLELDSQALSGLRNSYLGFVFQMHHLLPQLTLIENIMLPTLALKDTSLKKSAKDRALHLIEEVGLKDHIHKYPSSLSVGECQRTAVVRALINRPKLLVADEPTGSLDARNAEQLVQMLLDLKKELQFSMVIATHSMELAQRMDKTYKLALGKLTLL
jgi:lipoprotein-releasing system ATP-binding protein